MREWEQATWAAGQTKAEVIRRVGKAVARTALQMTRPGDLVLILAGKGHNGEDARCSQDGLGDRRVELLEVNDPAADLSRVQTALSLNPALVIDGLFGIGLNRPLSAEWVALIEAVNNSGRRVLAVDIPSGLNADTGESQGAAIRATTTLTVGAPKLGLIQQAAWPYVGRLEVTGDVGLTPFRLAGDVQWTMPEDFQDYPPPRQPADHKGSYGHLGIIAGSLGYHGAAVLAARGAQRARPGLITLHTLEPVYYVVASQLQAVMVRPWEPANKLPVHEAHIIGPGLAAKDVPEQMKNLVRTAWRDSTFPLVVDASALDWLPLESPLTRAPRVVTPHPGEAARLLRSTTEQVQANRVAAVQNLSKRFANAWVVLKGHQTIIGRSTGELFVNCSGNASMAQGGSGDILSGYIAGLLAQPTLQQDVLKTLRYAVWQHGAAADRLQAARSNWIVEDLLAELGNSALLS
jgi:NAD(P)H-hydrate epimerase